MVLASIAYGLCHVLAGREFLSRMYKGFLWSVRRLKGLKASAVGLSVVQKQPALFPLPESGGSGWHKHRSQQSPFAGWLHVTRPLISGSHGYWKLTQVGWAVLRYPAFFGSNKVKLTAESLATRGHFSVGADSPHCGLTPSAGTWAPRHLLGRGGAASSLRLVEGKRWPCAC